MAGPSIAIDQFGDPDYLEEDFDPEEEYPRDNDCW